MKEIIILLFFTFSISAHAQKGRLVIKIDNKEYIPKVEKESNGNKLKIKSEIVEMEETFSKYPIYKFKLLFPSAKRLSLLNYYILEVDGHKELMNEINQKHKDIIPYIHEYFEPIPMYEPNDYDFSVRFCNDGCRDVGLSYLDLINTPNAWKITKGDPDIIIGIFDSHLYTDHEDLTNKIFNIYGDNTRDNFFVNKDHGTHVAGIVAANTNNNTGISSVAFNCRIAKASWSKNYLLDMAEDGIKVINISQNWGPYTTEDQELMEALTEDYNITVIAAAGNTNTTDYFYPASYNNVISVTSIGHEFDRGEIFNNRKFNWKDVHKKYIEPDLPSFTHAHNDKVDICAPGYNVLTLCNPAEYIDNRLYHILDGTSFAAPQVAGVCALMYSINPGITPSEVENIIKATAVNIESIPENSDYLGKLGAGRIDAFEAVKEAGTTYLTGFQSTKSISAGYGFKLNDITINDNADVILTARKEVVINGTFEMPVGSTFEISIDPNAVTDGG